MLRGKDSYLIYDTSLVIAQEDASYIQRGFPATESAIKNLDKKVVANIIFLSAIVGWLKIVSPEALEKSVRNNVPAKYLDLNLKALEIGLELGRER
jgi:2-oxoglutarate ferredoxin oxidoreductase subunit gamma